MDDSAWIAIYSNRIHSPHTSKGMDIFLYLLWCKSCLNFMHGFCLFLALWYHGIPTLNIHWYSNVLIIDCSTFRLVKHMTSSNFRTRLDTLNCCSRLKLVYSPLTADIILETCFILRGFIRPPLSFEMRSLFDLSICISSYIVMVGDSVSSNSVSKYLLPHPNIVPM